MRPTGDQGATICAQKATKARPCAFKERPRRDHVRSRSDQGATMCAQGAIIWLQSAAMGALENPWKSLKIQQPTNAKIKTQKKTFKSRV